MKQIYLDNSATTQVDPHVLKAMMPYLKDVYGNPSSFHDKGREAKNALEAARKTVAGILNCSSGEIIFTGGGTESNNIAIQGLIARINADIHADRRGIFRDNLRIDPRKSASKKLHIITTNIEHPSVLEVYRHLEKEGLVNVTYLDVNEFGLISLEQLKKELRPETVLVSIIYANNEIGTVQDVKATSSIIHSHVVKCQMSNVKCRLHIDACQASGYETLNVEELGVDMMTINSSKVYGPKGVGVLYVKKGVNLAPLMYGGHQENGLRPGTENLAGIVGFSEALVLAEKSKVKNQKSKKLRDYFIEELFKKISKIRLNGHKTKRLANNVNVSILDIEGESLALELNEKGVYVSTGSACASGSLDPSHVIMALGVPYEVAHGSLRFSLGRKTTKKDIDYVLKVLPPIVEKLRAMSPVKLKNKY